MYSDVIFFNELNNCKLLYFCQYINYVTTLGSVFGGNHEDIHMGLIKGCTQ